MTDEQINIAIAEACGWHDLSIVDKTACGLKQKVTSLNGRYEPIPDYANDLNAMHEAEKLLKHDVENAWLKGGYSLYVQLLPYGNEISATARQRAEAFLRTLGKWEEVQP